jgi:hypothetical protein
MALSHTSGSNSTNLFAARESVTTTLNQSLNHLSFVFASPQGRQKRIGSFKKAHRPAITRAKIKRHFRIYDLREVPAELNSHLSRRILDLLHRLPRGLFVYLGLRLLQRIFLGSVLRRKILVPFVRCRLSIRMGRQRVIAPPKVMRQFMNYQFNFHALVN